MSIFVNFLHWLVVPHFILYSIYVYARPGELKFCSFEFQTLSRRKIVMFLAAISLRIVITSSVYQHNTRYLAKGTFKCIFPYTTNFNSLNLIRTWSDKALNGTVVNLYMEGHLKLRLQTLLYNSYIFATRFFRSLIFYTINNVRSNIQSLKYPRFPLAGPKDIGIRKLDLVGFVYLLLFLFS